MRKPSFGGGQVNAARLSDDVIRLVVPLTPSANELLRMMYSRNIGQLAKLKRAGLEGIRYSVAQLWPGGDVQPKPWADHITLLIVRCSNTHQPVDDDNIIGGAKYARDALVRVGIIPDDSPKHVHMGRAESRTAGHWGDLQGPATHFIIRRTG